MKRTARQTKKARSLMKVARIVASEMKPGDTLVIRTDGISMEDVNRSNLPSVLGCKVLFLPADARLDIVSPSADQGA